MGSTYNSVLMSFMAIERVFSILDSVPAIKDRPNATQMPADHKQIEFQNVSFQYVKNVPVLKNVNLTVNQGEVIALVGNSGGGKSTLVSLLPRFYDVTGGKVCVDGTDIRDFTLHSLRQNIAVVFQDNFLFAGTIRENIMMGNYSATENELQEAIHSAYLDEMILNMTDGIDTVIGERGTTLSGGQRQRVAIARALINNPGVIIADEPTGNLDRKNADEVVDLLISLKDSLKQTMVVVTHDPKTAERADRIYNMEDGFLVEVKHR